MAEAVWRALSDRKHLVIEAGTGVGKSFAYLVPAILATAGGEEPTRPAAQADRNLDLHDQFAGAVDHEGHPAPECGNSAGVLGRAGQGSAQLSQPAPIAQRDGSRRLAVSRGSRIRRAAQHRRAGPNRPPTVRWPISPTDRWPQVWDEAQSDHGNCMGRDCPTYADCFYYQARRRAQGAQLLVVNHALFFSDLALRRQGGAILPDYDAVVFDEAHNLEAVASDHLGLEIHSGNIEYMLNKLYNDRTNRGLLVHRKLADAQRQVLDCRFNADEFFDASAAGASYNGGSQWSRRAGPTSSTIPLARRW